MRLTQNLNFSEGYGFPFPPTEKHFTAYHLQVHLRQRSATVSLRAWNNSSLRPRNAQIQEKTALDLEPLPPIDCKVVGKYERGREDLNAGGASDQAIWSRSWSPPERDFRGRAMGGADLTRVINFGSNIKRNVINFLHFHSWCFR